MLTSHVEVQKVGTVAQQADVHRLVLSHIGDLASGRINERQWTAWAQQGYDGSMHVGNDLDVFHVGGARLD